MQYESSKISNFDPTHSFHFQIKAITEGFDEASNGTFYNLTDLTDDQENELKAAGCLMTNSDKYISSANAYQQWPTGRGVFVAEDKSMAIQVNGEDHFKFVSMESGKDFGTKKYSSAKVEE